MSTSETVARIKLLSKENGFKLKYICSNLGVRENYFNDCKNKGLNIPEDILTRVSIMLETSVGYLKGETDDPYFHISSVGMKAIPMDHKGSRPVIGLASAGNGVLAQQEYLGYEPVSPECDTDDFFWIKVEGDSMAPRIEDGDLVLVQRDVSLNTDTIMVVTVDDTEGFIKKVSIDEDTVTLHSFNPCYPPMVFGGSEMSRLRFIGKVVKSEREW